jgi:DNA-binding transcriptional LysR family regulator
VKRVATGWETELRLAVGDLVAMEKLYPLAGDFYTLESGTRLRLSREVFGGCWDALVSGRADLVIGAPYDVPVGGGFAVRELGAVEFQFAVAPFHPLALAPEPLANEDILRYRAIAAADSSRSLPPRTANILSGQDVLTVPDFRDKLEAHLLGLGVGWLPRHLAHPFAAAGRLVVKATEERQAPVTLVAAWRTGKKGRALEWFCRRLDEADWRKGLFLPS